MRVLTSPRSSDWVVMSSRREDSFAVRAVSCVACVSDADFGFSGGENGSVVTGWRVVCVPTSRWKSSDGSSASSESESRSRFFAAETDGGGGGGSSDTDDSSLDMMEERLPATEVWKSARESLRRARRGWR